MVGLTGASASADSVVEEEIDLLASAALLWRHRRYLAILVLTAAAVAAAVSYWLVPPKYEATCLVHIQPNGPEARLPFISSEAYREVLLSERILRETAAAVGEDEKPSVRVEPLGNSGTLRLVVVAGSPKKAEALGEEWYRAFLAQMKSAWTASLDRQLREEKTRLEGLREAWSETVSEASEEPGGAKIVVMSNSEMIVASTAQVETLQALRDRLARGEYDEALRLAPFQADRRPVGPRPLLNASLAGFIALIAGVFYVFLRDALRSAKLRLQAAP